MYLVILKEANKNTEKNPKNAFKPDRNDLLSFVGFKGLTEIKS